VPNLTHLHPGTLGLYIAQPRNVVNITRLRYTCPGSKGLSHLTLFYTLGHFLNRHNLTHLHPGTLGLYIYHITRLRYTCPGSKGQSHLTLFYTLGGLPKPP